MPVFGLGTWMMGGDKFRNPQNDDKENIKNIKFAIENGITHIDTAENYAEGYAEKIVGKAAKGFDRKKLFITSKVDKRNLRFNDLLKSAKGSLERLKTDYLDLYLIHAPNLEIPLPESMKAMDKLKKEGFIKNIGVSNFKKERLQEAQSYTKNKIIVNQVYYNLIIREPEKTDLLTYCQENDVILTAYRPLDRGMLITSSIKVLEKMAKKYGKTPAQIALNWLISQKNVITISKMNSEKHILDNLGTVGWEMEKSDIELLRREFPGQKDRSEILPLV